jgi:hypothetical protein
MRSTRLHIRSGGAANIILRVGRNRKSLAYLTLGCTFAAALFGFGAEVFSFRSAYEGLGREPLILLTRLFVYIALAVILVFRGGWWGVPAAVLMTVGATAAEWALFPLARLWAGTGDPSGYAERFGDVARPSYASWAAFDIIGVGIAAALAQGLRMMAGVDPRGLRDG